VVSPAATPPAAVDAAPAEFVWDELDRYKSERRFLDGYPDDRRSFYSPRDSVHPLPASLLASAQHSLALNMYGYDDEGLDDLIGGKLDSKHVYVRKAVVAAELRAVLDLNHDWMLKQMAEAQTKAGTG
jgi:hypothetical protein